MIQLQQLQKLFMTAIFDQDTGSYQQLANYLVEKEQLSQNDQIDIYRNSIFGSLTTALSQIYPVCHKLVGEDFFEYMAAEYIKKQPSCSADLANYGYDFDLFIDKFQAAQSLVYLPDVARLEWAWHRAFHSADHPGLDIAQLSALTREQQSHVIFQLAPEASLIYSAYPVDKIWQSNQSDEEPEEVVDLSEGVCRLLVWRKGYDMRIDRLQENEYLFLSAIASNKPFTHICQQFVDSDVNIEKLLPRSVQQGWIADFTQA